MRLVFLGTPDFSLAPLKAIYESKHEIVAVVSQPDRVNARGNKVIASPVKAFAEEKGIKVYQFEKISLQGADILRDLKPDIMVTAAYGQILSKEILDIAPHGIINVHASLLPYYRGSAPVQWALINGEKEIGVTIMQTELTVDSGDIILQKKITLDGSEDAGKCLDLLSVLGAFAVVEALDKIEDGSADFIKQDEAKATHCSKLTKEGGKIDFSKSATQIVNLIRGYTPNPSAYCESDFGRVKILSAKVSENNYEGKVGEVVYSDKKGITVKCGEGAIDVLVLQRENAKAMKIDEFLRGKPIAIGSTFR